MNVFPKSKWLSLRIFLGHIADLANQNRYLPDLVLPPQRSPAERRGVVFVEIEKAKRAKLEHRTGESVGAAKQVLLQNDPQTPVQNPG